MSKSYDRMPPPPPGTGQGDAYDNFYEAYDEPTQRPSAPPRAMRPVPPQPAQHPMAPHRPVQRQPSAPSPGMRHAVDHGAPFEHTQPPPRPRPPEPREPPASFDTERTDRPERAERPVERDMYAPARSQKGGKAQAHAPIVPAGSVTGRSLTLVIAIMCFLACLTAGAVYLINQSASAWLRDIASEVTVQVEARDKVDVDKVVRDVIQFVGRQPGIRTIRALPPEESASLLEPWLGNSEALKALPVPRLIAVGLDRASPPDFAAIREGLNKQFKGVTLDDHRQWQQQIRTVTSSFALGGIAILLLVAAATTAIIVSATRAAMSSNREIVEVLHFVGATDKFIAREFERNFMRVGIRAGLVGAVAAMAVFAAMPMLLELMGGGGVTMAELQRLVGAGALDLPGYGVLAALVLVVAVLCRFTSRISVRRILHAKS